MPTKTNLSPTDPLTLNLSKMCNGFALTITLHLCTSHTKIGLLRKEVIQPQLPLRLPCYDLAPVTGLTLGIILPCGLDK